MTTKLAHLFLGLFLITNSFFSYSQMEERMDGFGKFILKTNFRIPFATSNIFFKNTSEGVVDMEASVDYSFYKNFYVGVGYRYDFFRLSENKLNNSPNDLLNAKITRHGIYGELSYFFNLYSNFSVEANFQAGTENASAISSKCSITHTPTVKKGLFLSPNLNFYLKTDDFFAFYLSVGYTLSTNSFHPSDICVASFKDYTEEDYTGKYKQISVGIGITFLLNEFNK